MTKDISKRCSLCNCVIHNEGGYAEPNVKGRAHATKHHYVAERFFGRSKNNKHKTGNIIFESCPWGAEGNVVEFCYECHEELIHNPVLLPEDIISFSKLINNRGLSEDKKSEDKKLIAERIKLFHEIIRRGLESFEE